MTIKELKQNALKSKAFREVLNAIKHKPYVCEEALISEAAEKLFKQYKFIYSKLQKPEYSQYCYFIQKCILPKYKTFNEVVEVLDRLAGNQITDRNEIERLYSTSSLGKGTKYSTFIEALDFLNFTNKDKDD